MRFSTIIAVSLITLQYGFGVGSSTAYAQENSLGDRSNIFLSSQRAPIDIVFGAVYQTYADENGRELTQGSAPVALFVPLGQRLGFSTVANYAINVGDDVETVQGLTDAQVGLSYYQRIGAGSLVLSVGVNVPVGAREFTLEEYQTAVLFGQHFFNFRTPGFGQGLNVSPGLTLAFPVSDNVVFGLGAVYQNRGGYRPVDGMQVDLDPGEELLLTGGIDIGLGPVTSLSGDVTFTMFERDLIGEQEFFESGDRITVTGQLLSRPRQNELRLLGRFRSQSKSTYLALSEGTSDIDANIIPTQILLRASYRQRVGRVFSIGLLGQARMYDESDVFEAMTLLDGGVLPTLHLSNGLALELRFIYTTGDIEGFEAGGGLAVRL